MSKGFQNMTKEQIDAIRRKGLETRLKNKKSDDEKKSLNKTIRVNPKTWKKFVEVCDLNWTRPTTKINELIEEYIAKYDKK